MRCARAACCLDRSVVHLLHLLKRKVADMITRCQAGVTDDVPLFVLAGNVVPLAKGHHMTTVDVRNSSLVLVVAVPKDNAAFPAVSTAAWQTPAVVSDICHALVGGQGWRCCMATLGCLAFLRSERA